MKLNAFDRVLLAILLIVAIVFSFALLGMAAQVVSLSAVQGLISLLYANPTNLLILAGSALVLLLICIKLLLTGRGARVEKVVTPASTLMNQTELGGTFISLAAIDGMVQKHCRAQERVRDCHSTLRTLEDGSLTIAIRLSVLPDTDVATLTQQLQSSLREYIQSLAGINVKEIGILVESAAEEPTARVG